MKTLPKSEVSGSYKIKKDFNKNVLKKVFDSVLTTYPISEMKLELGSYKTENKVSKFFL